MPGDLESALQQRLERLCTRLRQCLGLRYHGRRVGCGWTPVPRQYWYWALYSFDSFSGRLMDEPVVGWPSQADGACPNKSSWEAIVGLKRILDQSLQILHDFDKLLSSI